MTSAPETGSPAPDFTLKDQDGQDVSLSSMRGHSAALLVFFPFAFSNSCTGELCEIRDDLGAFSSAGVQVLGVSCDPVHSLRAWAAQERYDFPLLSDFWPHGEVAKAYGVFNESRGMAVRGTFLIDEGGVVRFAEVNGPGEPRDQNGWRTALSALAA